MRRCVVKKVTVPQYSVSTLLRSCCHPDAVLIHFIFDACIVHHSHCIRMSDGAIAEPFIAFMH